MSGAIATLPRLRFTDGAGAPLVGGILTVYAAGTTTKENTWQDRALTILNTNPIILDSLGSCVVWLDSAKSYKVVLSYSSGASIWTQDNIVGGGLDTSFELSAAALQAAVDGVQASRTAIDNRLYPGTFAVAPTTRPDGSAIQNGDRYVNSTDGYEYIRVSGAWTNSASNATAAAASAAIAGTLANAIIRSSWTILSAIVGTAGQNAVVLSSDTGTHTDPVIGGTVNNYGVYQYSTSPAGWQRIGDTESVYAQDGAASHYFVQISGAPVPLGGYVAEKFARVSSTVRRFAYDITGGPATIQVKINGVIAHAAINVSGRGEQDVTFTIPADATVDFYVAAGTPTYVWALIDGSRP